jgi:hypothetical protein
MMVDFDQILAGRELSAECFEAVPTCLIECCESGPLLRDDGSFAASCGLTATPAKAIKPRMRTSIAVFGAICGISIIG